MSDNAVCGGAVSGDAVMNESLSLTHCDARKLADIPDFEQVEQLHRDTAPSRAAYDVIHGHCAVIATISWQIAHHCNMLLSAKSCANPMGAALRERAQLAQKCMSELIGDAYLTLPSVTGGSAPCQYVDEYAALVGGLIHDIGTYFVLEKDGSNKFAGELRFDGPHYILHGLRGYNYLVERGFSEDIAQFARNHTGVGLTREQVLSQNLPLPAADYMPRTLEQEIVMVADKYNSKSIPPRFLTVDSYRRKAARFGEDNALRWMQLVEKYGEPDIEALAKCFGLSVDA